MQRTLPASPSLVRLRHEAKELLKLRRAGDPEATARFASAHPRYALQRDASSLSLSDAHFVLAREYGFASWPKLKLHIDTLQNVEERVARLRQEFANADRETRERLLTCVHSRARFQDYDARATELSERDARLVVANEEGYAFWAKYESYLYLDPSVQQVIGAARHGELAKLQALLRADPGAANPRWVRGRTPERIPNDSIPLNCVSEGVFNGTNTRGNDYQLARALISASGEVDFDNGGPLKTAVSYYAPGAARALLDGGAAVDSPDGSGMPMAYALTAGVPFGASADSHLYDERRIPIIEHVLRHGASVTMRDSRFHSTPLGWANHHGATQIFDLLAPYAGVHDAVQFGLLDRLKDLLDRDAGLANARDELGQTPLDCLNAETPRPFEILELLLGHGADPFVENQAGETLYDKLESAGRLEVAEWLWHRATSHLTP